MMIRLRLGVLLVGFSLALASPTLAAAKEKPSSPEDRAKAVRIARELETDPLAEAGDQARQWIVVFYRAAPDIAITICNLFGPVPGEEHPFYDELIVQQIASSGAHIIEHPDQADDLVAVQTAGVEGVLKVYEAFVKVLPKGRMPYLDDLVKKRDQDTLREHLRQVVPKECS